MNKHNTEDYWDCNCRRYDEQNPLAVSYPDDCVEPLHARYVMLINKLQKLVEYLEANVLEEPDGAAYILDMIRACLYETGDVDEHR